MDNNRYPRDPAVAGRRGRLAGQVMHVHGDGGQRLAAQGDRAGHGQVLIAIARFILGIPGVGGIMGNGCAQGPVADSPARKACNQACSA